MLTCNSRTSPVVELLQTVASGKPGKYVLVAKENDEEQWKVYVLAYIHCKSQSNEWCRVNLNPSEVSGGTDEELISRLQEAAGIVEIPKEDINLIDLEDDIFSMDEDGTIFGEVLELDETEIEAIEREGKSEPETAAEEDIQDLFAMMGLDYTASKPSTPTTVLMADYVTALDGIDFGKRHIVLHITTTDRYDCRRPYEHRLGRRERVDQ